MSSATSFDLRGPRSPPPRRLCTLVSEPCSVAGSVVGGARCSSVGMGDEAHGIPLSHSGMSEFSEISASMEASMESRASQGADHVEWGGVVW